MTRFYEEETRPGTNYFLAVGNQTRAEKFPGGSSDLEQMKQEAIATFEQLHPNNPTVIVRVVNEDTRIVEFAVNENNYHHPKETTH
jgi:hypothetical protein